MLLSCVGSLSYMPHTVFLRGVYLIYSVLFYVGASLTLLVLILYAGSLFSMPYAIWYQELVLHTLCRFLWEGFLTVSSVFIRVESFFYTAHAVLCGKFLYNFMCLVLVYLGSFSCTLNVSLSGQFLLHVLCCLKCGVCLTHPLLFYVGSLSSTPCCFMWGVSLPRPMLFYVGISLTRPLLF